MAYHWTLLLALVMVMLVLVSMLGCVLVGFVCSLGSVRRRLRGCGGRQVTWKI